MVPTKLDLVSNISHLVVVATACYRAGNLQVHWPTIDSSKAICLHTKLDTPEAKTTEPQTRYSFSILAHQVITMTRHHWVLDIIKNKRLKAGWDVSYVLHAL